MLHYNPKTGDWSVEQNANGNPNCPTCASARSVLLLSTYDGALMPERVATTWRAHTADGYWEDAPGVSCKAGPEGKAAMEADLSAVSLKTALTPGWLFGDRASPVIEQIKAKPAGGPPSIADPRGIERRQGARRLGFGAKRGAEDAPGSLPALAAATAAGGRRYCRPRRHRHRHRPLPHRHRPTWRRRREASASRSRRREAASAGQTEEGEEEAEEGRGKGG